MPLGTETLLAYIDALDAGDDPDGTEKLLAIQGGLFVTLTQEQVGGSGGGSGDSTGYDFASAGGWTATNGTHSSTAAITSGFARLVIPASQDVPLDLSSPLTSWVAPRIEKTLPEGRGYRLTARLAAYTNADANSRATIGCHEGAIAGHPSTQFVGVSVRHNGDVEVFVDGVGTPVTTLHPSLPLGGTGWVAVEVVGAFASVYYGTGSGHTPPTQWTRGYTSGARGAGVCEITAMLAAATYSPGTAAQLTVDWDDVTITAL